MLHIFVTISLTLLVCFINGYPYYEGGNYNFAIDLAISILYIVIGSIMFYLLIRGLPRMKQFILEVTNPTFKFLRFLMRFFSNFPNSMFELLKWKSTMMPKLPQPIAGVKGGIIILISYLTSNIYNND